MVYKNDIRSLVSNLNIPNKELESIFSILLKKSLNNNKLIAVGIGGSFAIGRIDKYSDLDIFLIMNMPQKNFDNIIKELFKDWFNDLIIYQRGKVRYLGYPYNIIFPSLTMIDVFMNNKEIFEPCYLTPNIKILIDKNNWLDNLKKCYEDSININQIHSDLLNKDYCSFFFDSLKIINAIYRKEYLDAVFYINRLIDYLIDFIRINNNKLSSHPDFTRSHFEREFRECSVKFSELTPSYNKKDIIVSFKNVLDQFFLNLDILGEKYKIKRNYITENNLYTMLKRIYKMVMK